MNVKLVNVDIEELRHALAYTGLYVTGEGEDWAIKSLPEVLRNGDVRMMQRLKDNLAETNMLRSEAAETESRNFEKSEV